MNLTRIEWPLFTTLLLLGTDLLVRAALQGIEQALLSTVVEYCLKSLKAGRALLPA